MRLSTIAFLATLVACHQAGLVTDPRADARDSGNVTPPTQAPSNQDVASSVDALTGDAPVCAEQVQAATRIPVDLLFLIDASGSQADSVAVNKSKYSLLVDALTGFFGDRHSAGLGVALQFFPLPPETPCASDADCGPPGSGGPPWILPGCQVLSICAPPHAPLGITREICSPKYVPSNCSAPTSCAPTGYCSVTGWLCTAINEPCATGQAGDICVQQPQTCVGSDICNPAMFHRLDVPFGDLPAAAGALQGTVAAHRVGGGTPMGPALQAALANLADRSSQRPGRPGALVLVTDGLPNACGAADAPSAIAATIGKAAAGTPSFKTYVIGVVADNDPFATDAKAAFAQFATAGGTGAPILVSPTAGLSDALLKALQGIRTRAMPCQFEIPPPTGAPIDFNRVNVTIRGAAGASSVLYTAKADRCDPKSGGWYYDTDPASGAAPRRIVACPATCDAVKSDPEAEVDLRFGCKTMEIP